MHIDKSVHHPAPWNAFKLDYGLFFSDRNDGEIGYCLGTIRGEANAALIAAAPCMLNLIKDLYDDLPEEQRHSPMALRTAEIIQRATNIGNIKDLRKDKNCNDWDR